MMVGPTWCGWSCPVCLARTVAKADLWLLWLAVSLISLPPVVEDRGQGRPVAPLAGSIADIAAPSCGGPGL